MQYSHNIPRQVFNEFAQELQNLGFTAESFGLVGDYTKPGTPNVTPLPTTGTIGGPSSHNGFPTAHQTYTQAVREYVSNVVDQLAQGKTTKLEAQAQINALSKGLGEAAERGLVALDQLNDDKFVTRSDAQLLQQNRSVVAEIAARNGVTPNANLQPLASAGNRLLNAFKALGVAAGVIGLGIGGAQAAQQYRNGDIHGAGLTLSGLAGGIIGSIVTGAVVGSAVGPLGTVGGAIVGLGSGLIGGILGDWAGRSVFDSVNAAWGECP